MKKNSKLKIFFTFAIVEMLIICIFSGYFVYEITVKSKRLHRQTIVLQQKTELAKVANDLEEQKAETEEKIESVKKSFFNDVSFMEFLKDLSKISSAYGLTLNRVSFGRLKVAAKVTPPVMILPVSLSMSGYDYNGLVKFISYLEKQKYSIKPDTIAVTVISSRNKSKAAKQRAAEVNISFSVYIETQSNERWAYEGGR